MISTLTQDTKFTDAKILIVDDEQGNIRVLERMLGSAGYHNVTSTTDSRSTPDIYESIRPDLVLLDIKMPEFSGFDVMDALKDLERENTRLKRAVADLTLDKLILKEAAERNF